MCIKLIYLIGVFDGFSIMTSFFAELVHTGNGATCSDAGFMDLSTAEECSGSDAVNYAKSFDGNAHYKNVLSDGYAHKGCYMHDNGEMWFNTHITGRRRSDIFNICRKGST